MTFDYNFEVCPEIFAQGNLLRLKDEPDAVSVHEPEYVKWASKRHTMENKK